MAGGGSRLTPERKDELDKKKEEIIKMVTGKIEEELIKGGIAAEKIIIKSGHPSKQELQGIDQPDNWVIIDRHSTMLKDVTVAKKLNLPANSFYNSAYKQGLINIFSEELTQKLEEILKKTQWLKFRT